MQKEKFVWFFDLIYFYISAIYGFLWLNPFFVWNNQLIRYFGILYFTVFLIWMVVKNYNIKKANIFSFLFALLLIFMYSFKDDNVLRNFFLYSASLVPLTLINKEDCIKIYDRFIKVVSISLLPAVIIAVLLLIGFDLHWTQLLSTSWTKPYYRDYFNLAIYPAYGGVSQQYFLPWGGSIDRISGMFDEPGVVGTICALILISKDISLKRIYEKIILVAGIFSFSFAFYFMIILYLVIKKYKYSLFIFLGFFLLLQSIPHDSYFYTKILYRFEISSSGIQGDNRTNDGFDQLYSDFLQNDNVMMGIKESEFLSRAKAYGSEALSWKTFVVINGLLLFILHTLYFAGYSLAIKHKRILIFSLFYFISIYQRPYDFSLGYWLIFWGGIAAYEQIILPDNKKESTSILRLFKRGELVKP